MLSFLGNLLAPFALKIMAGLALAGAVLAVLFGAKQAGRTAEKVDMLTQARKVSNERRKIDDDVRRAGPAAARDELRGWASADGDPVRSTDADPAHKG